MQTNRKLALCESTFLRLVSGAAMAMLVAMPTVSHATDTWGPVVDGISGSMCQPSNGSQWADFTINPDGLRNNSTQNRYISCTMLARNMSGIDQADFDAATAAGAFRFFVYFDYSQVPTASITYVTTCTVFAKQMATGTTASESFNVSSIRTTSPVFSSIEPTTFNGRSANSYGAYSFNCRLPPGVKLYGYTQVTWGDAGGYRYIP